MIIFRSAFTDVKVNFMTVKAKDTSIRYNQTKRVIEQFLKKAKANNSISWWLESCGVCSCCCAIEAVGAKFKCELPNLNGKEFISQADLMFSYSYKELMPIGGDLVFNNEIPENLTKCINDLSTAKAELKKFSSVDEFIKSLKNSLLENHAVVLSYKTDYNSGHYICLVGMENDNIIAYDSWSDNKHCSNNGILEKYSIDFFKERCKDRLRYIDIS